MDRMLLTLCRPVLLPSEKQPTGRIWSHNDRELFHEIKEWPALNLGPFTEEAFPLHFQVNDMNPIEVHYETLFNKEPNGGRVWLPLCQQQDDGVQLQPKMCVVVHNVEAMPSQSEFSVRKPLLALPSPVPSTAAPSPMSSEGTAASMATLPKRDSFDVEVLKESLRLVKEQKRHADTKAGNFQDELQKTIKQWEESTRQAAQYRGAAQQDRAELLKQVQEWKNKYDQSQIDLHEHMEEEEKHQEQLQELQSKARQLVAASDLLRNCETDICHLEDEKRAMHNEIQELTTVNMQLTNEKQDVESEMLALQQEVLKEEQLVEELKTTMMQNKTKLENETKSLEQMRERFDNFKQKAGDEKQIMQREHEEEIKLKNETIMKAEEEVERYKEMYEQSMQEVEHVKMAAHQAATEAEEGFGDMLVSFQNEHNQTLMKKHELDEELHVTREQKDKHIGKLNDHVNELVPLAQQAKSLLQVNTSLRGVIDGLHEQVAESDGRLLNMDAMYRATKLELNEVVCQKRFLEEQVNSQKNEFLQLEQHCRELEQTLRDEEKHHRQEIAVKEEHALLALESKKLLQREKQNNLHRILDDKHICETNLRAEVGELKKVNEAHKVEVARLKDEINHSKAEKVQMQKSFSEKARSLEGELSRLKRLANQVEELEEIYHNSLQKAETASTGLFGQVASHAHHTPISACALGNTPALSLTRHSAGA